MKHVIIDLLTPHVDALVTALVAAVVRWIEKGRMKRAFKRDAPHDQNSRA